MASFTMDYSASIALHTSQTLASGNTANASLDLKTPGYYAAAVQVAFDIASGTPSGDVVINVYGSVDGGRNVDTERMQRIAIPFSAIGNKKRSILVGRVPWARVAVTNSTGASGTLVSSYSGLKQLSA